MYSILYSQENSGVAIHSFIHRHEDAFTLVFLLHDLFIEPDVQDVFQPTQISSDIGVKY